MNSRKKFILNTILPFIQQIATIISGLILPRLFLETYGSAVNGLVNSVAQFLQVIAFLELGVGAVLQSSIYKPLADKDDVNLSRVMRSGNRFFRRLALILLIYVAVLFFLYPLVINKEFDWLFVVLLIAAMSIDSFAQYYFGIVDTKLLVADQKIYLSTILRIIAVVVNLGISVLMIRLGAPVQLVKFLSSLIYLIRPIFIAIYVKKNYKIDKKIEYTEEPIKQKWNGIAQHVSSFILDGTDTIVLTVFTSLSVVSVYSVHNMVLLPMRQLMLSSLNGIEPLMGEKYAKNDKQALKTMFSATEWIINMLSIFAFGCTAMLIVPFISVYTNGINDAEYFQPIFAGIITIAQAFYCLRLPYSILIQIAGRFKETQWCYIIGAILNLGISVIAVFFLGLIGVAIGTLIAMLFQTVWMAIYCYKNIVERKIIYFIKQLLTTVVCGVAIYFSTFWIVLGELTYLSWFIMAIKVAAIVFAVTLGINVLFYFKNFKSLIKKIINRFSKNKPTLESTDTQNESTLTENNQITASDTKEEVKE